MGQSKTNQQPPGLLRHLVAMMLPFMMTVVIPLLLTGTFNLFWGVSFPFQLLLILIGAGLLTGGLALVTMTINLFRTIGQGTLAPWDPTHHLVIRGVYRYVRNPMISGVMGILLGEMILLGSPAMVLVALVFMLVNMVYIPTFEEPGLRHRFGTEYDEYTQHVPRWLPRRTPWIPITKA